MHRNTPLYQRDFITHSRCMLDAITPGMPLGIMSLRVFAALPLSETVADQACDEMTGVPDANWRPRENLHITLCFYGELDEPVLVGGPVQTERGLVLHSDDVHDPASLALGHGLMLSSTRDALQSIGAGCGPEHFLLALGHAGWGPGQLEDELSQNAWLTCPASHRVLFEVPFDERIEAAASDLGIDFRLMGAHAGHA